MANDIYLTDREADVMRVLWEHGASVVSEVKDKLADELAYTVASLLPMIPSGKASS